MQGVQLGINIRSRLVPYTVEWGISVVTVESLDSRKLLYTLSSCQVFRDVVAGQQTGCMQRGHQVY
jgi:hypothetical protein